MAKEKLTMEHINQLDLPNLFNYAIPIIILLLLIEFFIITYKNKKKYSGKDFLASAGIGIGNVVIGALTKVLFFGFILFFYNLVPWQMPHSWWSFLLCFSVLDLCRYWAHRISHEQRFWWATHVTHHSSEQLNWSTSFRVSWTQQIKIIFFIPIPLMGFDPIIFLICHQIAVLYQFWVHTEIVPKLPYFIEYFFVTPSHHRVHHAKNKKYIDKNYGSTYIIWDRLFNSFQEEEEKPEYGITTPVNSFNPIYLNFHEWIDIVKDFRTSKTWKERFNAVFGRPK
ncbi:MAG: sterol desaturase family protein [Flavobacteriales bacterium]|nr:sterol desaturase family protein [Flavobacteriales bacterium]